MPRRDPGNSGGTPGGARIDRQTTLILLLGAASCLPYLYAWRLKDLRENTVPFLVAFFAAFILYGIAVSLALKMGAGSNRRLLLVIFALAVAFNALLVLTPPTLSDDMYRYVWDGRVQAQGISPYRYPPADGNLVGLRDPQVWRFINRKTAVTVYPPAAELAFATLWHIQPDSVRWFQAFTAGMALLGGVLLLGVLRDLDRSPGRALIYVWSPLLIYETAHAAHVDGLILPLLVGAWWARLRERDGLTGALLGVAAAMKFYPALLLPALWRSNHPQGRWRMPLTFSAAFVISYLPYLLRSGADVVGFLPGYVRERFNISPLVNWLLETLPGAQISGAQRSLLLLTFGILGLASLYMVLRPAKSGEEALRRCLWPIAIVTLLNPNLFSWYSLWLLPLLAVFMQPGRVQWRGGVYRLGLRLDAWTGWWLFTGLSALSYTFFIDWKSIPAAIGAQFWPLYAFLATDLLRRAPALLSSLKSPPSISLPGGAKR